MCKFVLDTHANSVYVSGEPNRAFLYILGSSHKQKAYKSHRFEETNETRTSQMLHQLCGNLVSQDVKLDLPTSEAIPDLKALLSDIEKSSTWTQRRQDKVSNAVKHNGGEIEGGVAAMLSEELSVEGTGNVVCFDKQSSRPGEDLLVPKQEDGEFQDALTRTHFCEVHGYIEIKPESEGEPGPVELGNIKVEQDANSFATDNDADQAENCTVLEHDTHSAQCSDFPSDEACSEKGAGQLEGSVFAKTALCENVSSQKSLDNGTTRPCKSSTLHVTSGGEETNKSSLRKKVPADWRKGISVTKDLEGRVLISRATVATVHSHDNEASGIDQHDGSFHHAGPGVVALEERSKSEVNGETTAVNCPDEATPKNILEETDDETLCRNGNKKGDTNLGESDAGDLGHSVTQAPSPESTGFSTTAAPVWGLVRENAGQDGKEIPTEFDQDIILDRNSGPTGDEERSPSDCSEENCDELDEASSLEFVKKNSSYEPELTSGGFDKASRIMQGHTNAAGISVNCNAAGNKDVPASRPGCVATRATSLRSILTQSSRPGCSDTPGSTPTSADTPASLQRMTSQSETVQLERRIIPCGTVTMSRLNDTAIEPGFGNGTPTGFAASGSTGATTGGLLLAENPTLASTAIVSGPLGTSVSAAAQTPVPENANSAGFLRSSNLRLERRSPSTRSIAITTPTRLSEPPTDCETELSKPSQVPGSSSGAETESKHMVEDLDVVDIGELIGDSIRVLYGVEKLNSDGSCARKADKGNVMNLSPVPKPNFRGDAENALVGWEESSSRGSTQVPANRSRVGPSKRSCRTTYYKRVNGVTQVFTSGPLMTKTCNYNSLKRNDPPPGKFSVQNVRNL